MLHLIRNQLQISFSTLIIICIIFDFIHNSPTYKQIQIAEMFLGLKIYIIFRGLDAIIFWGVAKFSTIESPQKYRSPSFSYYVTINTRYIAYYTMFCSKGTENLPIQYNIQRYFVQQSTGSFKFFLHMKATMLQKGRKCQTHSIQASSNKFSIFDMFLLCNIFFSVGRQNISILRK